MGARVETTYAVATAEVHSGCTRKTFLMASPRQFERYALPCTLVTTVACVPVHTCTNMRHRSHRPPGNVHRQTTAMTLATRFARAHALTLTDRQVGEAIKRSPRESFDKPVDAPCPAWRVAVGNPGLCSSSFRLCEFHTGAGTGNKHTRGTRLGGGGRHGSTQLPGSPARKVSTNLR